jgi:hypothetical protein
MIGKGVDRERMTDLIFPPTENERLHHLLSSRDSLLGEKVGVRVDSDLEDRSESFFGVVKVVGKDEVEDRLHIGKKARESVNFLVGPKKRSKETYD